MGRVKHQGTVRTNTPIRSTGTGNPEAARQGHPLKVPRRGHEKAVGLESHCEDTSNRGDTVPGLRQPPERGSHPQLSLWPLQGGLLGAWPEQCNPGCTHLLLAAHTIPGPAFSMGQADGHSTFTPVQTSSLLGGLPGSSWSTELPLNAGPGP